MKGVGIVVPYLMLVLTMLEEHYAMWFLFFFIIPLLDVMFYVEIPTKDMLTKHLVCKGCLWMWFPWVAYTSCLIDCSFPAMISMGILYNSTLCLADEMARTDAWYENELANVISDYLGFVRFEEMVSVFRSSMVLYLMGFYHRLWWHIGAVLVSSVLYEYVCWVEYTYFSTQLSHYGLSNYSMFRFHHSNQQLLPTSHMWVLFYLFLHEIDSFLELD